jgi:hypothetical protein
MPDGYITLKSSRNLELTVLLGDASPVLSDGVSTWETITRPKREAITRYSGLNPLQQTIVVLFDGWANNESQESRINKLVTMGSQEHTITLKGDQALRKDLDWVISGIAWDSQNTIWKNIGGKLVRVRQSATITLLEFVADKIIKTPAAPKTKKDKVPIKKKGQPKGLTVKQIAQVEFGDPDKWRLVISENPILLGDGPRTLVPAGTLLTFIDGQIPLFVVP